MQVEKFLNKNLDVRTRAGDEWTCLCPYHDDTSPSFSVNVKRGLFICFACGAKGTVADLAKFLRVGAPSIVVTEESEKDKVSNLLEGLRGLKEDKGNSVIPESFLARFNNPTNYWKHRGFSKETIEFFGLGYDAMSNHAIIPLRESGGGLVGVIRRQLDEDAMPRYLYPKGFKINQHLFNANTVQKYDRIAIVEGSLDCIACHESGIPAVAILGSYVSNTQYDMLRKLNPDYFVVMTDRDNAGRRAAGQIMAELGRRVLAPEYKNSWIGKDPADLWHSQRKEMFDGARY